MRAYRREIINRDLILWPNEWRVLFTKQNFRKIGLVAGCSR